MTGWSMSSRRMSMLMPALVASGSSIDCNKEWRCGGGVVKLFYFRVLNSKLR
jgi:hypothetical protein